MSNPEISRRCTSCGATVRQRAMFCPQCGNEMGGNDQEAPFNPTETIAESRDARAKIDAAQPTAFDPPVTKPLRPVPSPTEALRPPVDEKVKTQALSGIERAGTAAVVQPAEKKAGRLKKVSSVVLDQAAYDPSLRFLLVAVGFFLVFLLLLLLSKVVG